MLLSLLFASVWHKLDLIISLLFCERQCGYGSSRTHSFSPEDMVNVSKTNSSWRMWGWNTEEKNLFFELLF